MPRPFTYSIKIIFTLVILSLLIIFGCKKIVEPNNDSDSDGIEDKIDNCIDTYNPDQIDTDGDGIGDVCDSDNSDGPLGDLDEDGIKNSIDNCLTTYNPDQADDDDDGIGNLCDPDWVDPNGDLDGDGIPNNQDSCPNDYNKGTDYNNDGIDDACDPPPPEYALTFGLYDDFDGNGALQTYNGLPLAVAGDLSDSLWRHLASEDVSVVDLTSIVNDSISYGANPSGNIVKMVNDTGGDMRLEVVHPMKINFADYQSFSADVMISSESESNNYKIALDFHTSIPEQGGSSWLSQIKLIKDANWDDGKVYISSQCMNKNTEYNQGEFIQDAEVDIWYNLRMDIVKLNETEIEVKFYVNDELKNTMNPPNGEILLDPSRLLFGPIRSFELNKRDRDNPDKAIANIDNIEAVYENRIQ